MRRVALLGGVIVATLVGSVATAGATSQDVASTHAYIRAEIGSAQTLVNRYPREVAALNALVNHVAVNCPKVLAGEVGNTGIDQRRTLQSFLSETTLELALAEVSPVYTAVRRAEGVEEHLRWSDPAIHRAILKNARQNRETLRLKPPDLCVQAKASAATGFADLPPASTRFLKAADKALESKATPADPLKLMKRFAPKDVAAATKRLAELDKRAATRDLKSLPKIETRMLLALFGTTKIAS